VHLVGREEAHVARHHVEGLAFHLGPVALFLPRERLEERIRTMLAEAAGARGYIFNLGHGISQFTPPENVNVLVDTVHSYSREIRARG